MDLPKSSAEFAEELQRTIAAILPGDFCFRSIAYGNRFKVALPREEGDKEDPHIPLFVGNEHQGSLWVDFLLGPDSSGKYLKTWSSKIHVYSRLERTPLVRYEFDGQAGSIPRAHWHVQAQRGALTYFLTCAQQHRVKSVKRPHDISSLHFPVGGERFRPCVEDVLEFLIRECGVDCKAGWKTALQRGREQWRLKQLRSAVRDLQDDAADQLRKCGWRVEAPEGNHVEGRRDDLLHRW